jgi:hypothetical protein
MYLNFSLLGKVAQRESGEVRIKAAKETTGNSMSAKQALCLHRTSQQRISDWKNSALKSRSHASA